MKVSLAKLNEFVDQLIAEGRTVLGSVGTDEWEEPDVGNFLTGEVSRWRRCHREVFNTESCACWSTRCSHLAVLLGDHAPGWTETLANPIESSEEMRRLIGTLEGIKKQIQAGLLVSLHDLISADIFDNMLEQAEYLHNEGYHVAAGVLGRAVLEEHLRNWCDSAKCVPNKNRCTINDYNSALYNDKHIKKTTMKHVEALAAIGNDAAHVNPDLAAEDITRLLQDVREFITKHTVA